jgi:hypothetical protein
MVGGNGGTLDREGWLGEFNVRVSLPVSRHVGMANAMCSGEMNARKSRQYAWLHIML